MSHTGQSIFVTVRNVIANWGGFVVNIVVAFLMSPFIVHSLGDVWYGVWTILMSLAGSMGLVELGVVVTTGRMVNYHLGRNDHAQVSSVVNLSLVFFSLSGLILLVAIWFARDSFAASIEGTRSEELPLIGYALVILVANVIIGLINSVFAVLLQARDRFDLKNLIDVTALLIRTAATIVVLNAGYGIQGLALVTFFSAIFSVTSMAAMARWKGHWPEFGLRLISRESFHETLRFSGWAFVNQASVRIFLYVNSIIIGTVSGATHVTWFSIALMLVDYSYRLASQVASALTPELNRAAGAGDKALMRHATTNGLQLASIAGIPIMIGLIFFATPFIGLWMGEKYAAASGTVAAILAFGKFSGVINGPLGIAIWSVGRIKFIAIVNLLMSVIDAIGAWLILTHTDYGLVGVASMTATSLIIINWIAMTVYATHLLDWPLREYLKIIARYPLPATLIYALIAWLLTRSGWIMDWPDFIVASLASVALYAPFAWLLLVRPFLKGRKAPSS